MQKLCKLSIFIFSTLLSSIANTDAFNSVCFYSNEAIYYLDPNGENPASIYPSDIDATLCTHFVYSFASLDSTTYEITSSNEQNDVTRNRYLEFTGLRAKNNQSKFLLALGGSFDSNDGTGKYSNLVKSTANINKLVNSTVAFLKKYQFDGLSFDWLFPNSTDDFAGYTAVIIALKTAFKQDNFLLSSSVSALQNYIDGYNVSILNNYLDLVNLGTFDYYTPDSSPTIGRHSSALYSPPNDPPAANMTVDFSVQYWLAKGLSPRLINVGIPLFSRSWKMDPSNKAPYLQPVVTASDGFVALYSDICYYLKAKDITDGKMNIKQNISSYAFKIAVTSYWLSYDSAAAVASKVVYAIKNGLGGVALFEIAQDDVKNQCGGGPYPIVTLVSTMSNSVRSSSIGGQSSTTTTTTPYPTTVTDIPSTATSPATSPTTRPATRPATSSATLPPGKCDCSCPVPDPTSCKSFNVLLDGISYKTSCPTGKYFNSTSLKCDDDPTNTKCPPSTEGKKKLEILSYNAVKYDWKVAY